MKRPFLNEDQRKSIRLNTMQGACFALNLEIMKAKRDSYKFGGYFYMRKTIKGINKLLNYRLLNVTGYGK